MNVLIACECSGIVRDAFAARGHNAWSCDLKPSERPGKHLQMDVRELLVPSEAPWDLLIVHPECTYLTVSNNGPIANGCTLYSADEAKRRREAAVNFFMRMVEAPIDRIAVENPIGIMSTRYHKPDQIIQPYWFGDDASKKTCLWLKGLPPLVARNPFPPRVVWNNGDWRMRWANQCDSGQNALGPDEKRSEDRARTYVGLANAMADQWGCAAPASSLSAPRSSDPTQPGTQARQCTCHPTDNPPQPCAQKYALSECVRAANQPDEGSKSNSAAAGTAGEGGKR